MELLPTRKTHQANKSIKPLSILTVITIILVLITLIRLNNPGSQFSSAPSNNPAVEDIKIIDDKEHCDIFRGEWIPTPDAPYYTNTTCSAIHDHQNCMKYGRPDTGFLRWRWKPDGCDLEVFDPFKFLDIVRGKSLAFVGDSLGRNQMQSMICLLSKVEYPIDVSPTSDEYFKRWKYINYNFTMVYFWSPFLVRYDQRDSDGPTHAGTFNLYLDKFDESWTTKIDEFDYVIINSGHWFSYTGTVYHKNQQIVGCSYCQLPNITDIPHAYGYRQAFKTAFKAFSGRENFKGIIFLRTFTPSHFENGLWNTGGNCIRQRPFRKNETILDASNLDMYLTQLEEFQAAKKTRNKRFKLMDITNMMLLRPDGHPSKYGHQPGEKVRLYNDCVHWCLPGPIDSWAEIFLHTLKMEV